MAFLTESKDANLLIMENLTDREVISLCLVNKSAKKLCDNENFWRNRFIKNHGQENMKYFQDSKKSWKKIYLSLVKYGDISSYTDKTGKKKVNLGRALELSAKDGDKEFVDFYLGKGAAEEIGSAIGEAILAGQTDMVYYLIKRGNEIFGPGDMDQFKNDGLIDAARAGNVELVNYFISRGANKWEWGLQGAAQGGHRNLVDFFIEKGAHFWKGALKAAKKGGHQELIVFFQSKPKNPQDSP